MRSAAASAAATGSSSHARRAALSRPRGRLAGRRRRRGARRRRRARTAGVRSQRALRRPRGRGRERGRGAGAAGRRARGAERPEGGGRCRSACSAAGSRGRWCPTAPSWRSTCGPRDAEQGAAVLRDDPRHRRRAPPAQRSALALSGGITRPAVRRAGVARAVGAGCARAPRELGIPLAAVGSRGGSDASFAAALGVPTIDGLGPICHDSCARGERIELDSLAERGALMALSSSIWPHTGGRAGPSAAPAVRPGTRGTSTLRRSPWRGSAPSSIAWPTCDHVLLVAEVQREGPHVAVEPLERQVAEGGARAAHVKRRSGSASSASACRGAAPGSTRARRHRDRPGPRCPAAA